MKDEHYSCMAAWHIGGRKSRYAFPIYNLLLEQGDCMPSTKDLAKFLDLNHSTVVRAIEYLKQIGFLEQTGTIGKGAFFRAIPHEEWVLSHPNQCHEHTADLPG